MSAFFCVIATNHYVCIIANTAGYFMIAEKKA
jgi:hypothetical protein